MNVSSLLSLSQKRPCSESVDLGDPGAAPHLTVETFWVTLDQPLSLSLAFLGDGDGD